MSPGTANLIAAKANAEPPASVARAGKADTPSGFDDALRSAQGNASRESAESGRDDDPLAETQPTSDIAGMEARALAPESVPQPPATDAPIVVDAGLLTRAAALALKPDDRDQPAEGALVRGLKGAQSDDVGTPAALQPDRPAIPTLPATPALAQPSGTTANSPLTTGAVAREMPGESKSALHDFGQLALRANEPATDGTEMRDTTALPRMAEVAESRAAQALEATGTPTRVMAGETSVTSPLASRHDSSMPPARLAIEAPVGTARFIDQAAQRVTWMAKNGVEHAEIRVRPAELGPITVRIELANNEVMVNFAVAQPDTRVAVEDALHRLEEMLAENGLAMSGANVGAQGSDGDEPARSGRQPAAEGSAPGAVGGASAGVVTVRTMPAPRGLVDTFA